jgi:hypothetical protein
MTLFFYFSEFDPEYRLVANGFQKNKANKDLFFGRLDFKDGQAIYQKVRAYLYNVMIYVLINILY